MTTIPKPTAAATPTDEAETPDEELKFVIPGDRRIEAANAITTRSMARRLPQLIRRSLALGWQVDRAAVIALLAVQLLSGVLEAFGLMATTGVIKPLIASQHISGDQLRSAVPSLVVLSGAIGLRALLGIASTALSARLAPALPERQNSSSSTRRRRRNSPRTTIRDTTTVGTRPTEAWKSRGIFSPRPSTSSPRRHR